MGGRPVWLAASALAVALAVIAAGCGQSAAKRKDEFLRKANAICMHFDDQQNQVRVPSVNPLAAKTSHVARAQWGLALKQIAYLGSQEVKELRKLKPPKDLEEDFRRLLDTKSGAFAELVEGADAAKRNRVSKIAAPVAAGRVGLSRAATQARSLGLDRCA